MVLPLFCIYAICNCSLQFTPHRRPRRQRADSGDGKGFRINDSPTKKSQLDPSNLTLFRLHRELKISKKGLAILR